MHRTLFFAECNSISIHNNSRKTIFSKCKNIIFIVAFVVSLHPNVVSWLECVCVFVMGRMCVCVYKLADKALKVFG